MPVNPDQTNRAIDDAKRICSVIGEDVRVHYDAELTLELTKVISAITKSVEHHPEDWMFTATHECGARYKVTSHCTNLLPLSEMIVVEWWEKGSSTVNSVVLVFSKESPCFSGLTLTFTPFGGVSLYILDKDAHVAIDHIVHSKESRALYRMIKEMAQTNGKALAQRRLDLCRQIVSFMDTSLQFQSDELNGAA